ncbi:ribosome maturation factor RimP [Krasilnikoviella flava]|uniref:Ribosome maturation factor RimP n=1 Tax=Krasilnikoviella flava TaxID=526729 RepID=A0A1T5LSP1_9MICO|nr:ribosome maturation factor RimP [Krasilnikoviella flava]SKC78904.1 ribosome maturation factor RimP [Krasilnikoviella flava]
MAAQHGRTAADDAKAEAVRRVVTPAVDAAGLFLEDVVLTRAGAKSVVRITVDLPEDARGSLDSDTLGDVSRAISAALDADDVVPGAYTLETSTPGTSRPLTEPRHFRRARGRLVVLQLRDGGTASGRLVEVDGGADTTDDDAHLVLEDGTRVPLADVRRGKIEVELKRLDEAPDETDTDTGDARDDTTGSARHEEG